MPAGCHSLPINDVSSPRLGEGIWNREGHQKLGIPPRWADLPPLGFLPTAAHRDSKSACLIPPPSHYLFICFPQESHKNHQKVSCSSTQARHSLCEVSLTARMENTSHEQIPFSRVRCRCLLAQGRFIHSTGIFKRHFFIAGLLLLRGD